MQKADDFCITTNDTEVISLKKQFQRSAVGDLIPVSLFYYCFSNCQWMEHVIRMLITILVRHKSICPRPLAYFVSKPRSPGLLRKPVEQAVFGVCIPLCQGANRNLFRQETPRLIRQVSMVSLEAYSRPAASQIFQAVLIPFPPRLFLSNVP